MSCYLRVLTFVSCSILVLCFRTFDNDYHECARPCSDKASSKRTCVYHFFVRESYSPSSCNRFKNETSTCANIIAGRNRLLINGKSPGPAVEICLGDTLDVLVYNKLGSDELAFHWHGIRQKGSNHMDGVPMITQCPILPFSGFRYTITPDSAGTYFYHAHSGTWILQLQFRVRDMFSFTSREYNDIGPFLFPYCARRRNSYPLVCKRAKPSRAAVKMNEIKKTTSVPAPPTGFILTPVYAVERRSASGARIKKSKINNARGLETAGTGAGSSLSSSLPYSQDKDRSLVLVPSRRHKPRPQSQIVTRVEFQFPWKNFAKALFFGCAFKSNFFPAEDNTRRTRVELSQQGDGVYGSLTVRGPQDDPTLERILVLSSRPSTPLTRRSYLHPSELLVNGQEREAIVQVKHGLPYLLRLINANAHDCPILLSVHGHSLRVLAADGNPVQSMRGTHVVLFPGERLDGVLVTDQAIGNYALDIRGLRDCRNLRHEAHILYEGAKVDSYTIKATDNFHDQVFNIIDSGHNCHRASKNVICSLDLKSKDISQLEEKADETIYVSVDANAFSNFTDEMTDESYNFYTSRYYPAYLSLEKGVKKIPQINGMSFKYPSSPILSQPEDALRELICSLEKRSRQCADTPLFCECLQIVQVPSRKTIEIVLINEGFGDNVSYTFHSHGYNGSVVGRGSFERPVTKEEIVSLDRERKMRRNLRNPVRKDTFVVPNKGYVILRLYTDNIGYWLWEARSTAMYPELFGPGMQFLMRVGLHRNLPPVPINFPTCGNNKGLDLIFETS